MHKQNHEVGFSTLANIKDNGITNWYSLEWEQFAELLESQAHLVTHNKDVSLISPWKYKTTDQQFEPRRTSDGEPWLIDDKQVVGRLATNVLGTDVLMFDFDGTITTSEAKSLFGKYTHLGYTSFSHMSEDKGGGECFRVVVPLAQFVTTEQLVDRRTSIYADFQGVDTSCLSLARSFYVPSVKPERKHLAHMWRRDGVLFDVLDYTPNTYISPVHSPVIHQTVDQEKLVAALKQVYLGKEPEWFKVAVAMQANDFSFDQFCDVSIGHLMAKKDRRDCERKWRSAATALGRGQSISVGFLVNVCKKHGTWKSRTRVEYLNDELATVNEKLEQLESKRLQLQGKTQ